MSEEEKAQAGGGGKGAIIGFVIATLLAVGGGAGMGFLLAPKFKVESAKHAGKEEAAEEEKKEQGAAERYARDSKVVKLQPVTTNLRRPFRSWVRLEGALIVKDEKKKDEGEEEKLEDENRLTELAALVQQDLLAYLRTLSLKDLEGASSLSFLRDDINERVRLRSGGRVSEFIILSLVVE